MENITVNQNPEQQPITPTPEASGGQGEKLFTQAQVNEIVRERLARERAKTEPSPLDEREAALKARESALDCREYLRTNQYSPELADILDTSDTERFKATVEKLAQLPGGFYTGPTFTIDLTAPLTGSPGRTAGTTIADAFKPPEI